VKSGEFIVQVIAIITPSSRIFLFHGRGAEPQEGGRLALAWTDWRSEGAQHPDEVQVCKGVQRGQWP